MQNCNQHSELADGVGELLRALLMHCSLAGPGAGYGRAPGYLHDDDMRHDCAAAEGLSNLRPPRQQGNAQ